jgi:hypothetical protein
MKYCQSPRCHYYNTNDRLKGNGGDKNFQTRKGLNFILVVVIFAP